MKTEQIDLGSLISCLSSATEEEKYEWRFSSVIGNYVDGSLRQLTLLATLGERDDYSVIEVVTRKFYKDKNKTYAPDNVALALAGDNKYGKEINEDIGLSMAIMHVVEIASLTFYRDLVLTPVHYMLAEACKMTINFQSPWGEWSSDSTWSKNAYNYGELICSRQLNLTEDQQRRIEGLALEMLKNRASAYSWLCEKIHSDFTGLNAWNAVKKFGFNAVVKHLCWADREIYEYGEQ